jgi:ferredoxin
MKLKPLRLDAESIQKLIHILGTHQYEVLGPVKDGPAVHWGPVASIDDLASGWRSSTSPGRYRAEPSGDNALFGAANGADSCKRYFHSPEARLFSAKRDNGAFHIIQEQPKPRRFAFLGIRACDLAGVRLQDRVLLQDRYADEFYQANRGDALFIAVHCSESLDTCFCASMDSGPRAKGADIALTERSGHEFLAEAGSPEGASLLSELGASPAPPEWMKESQAATDACASSQTRRVEWRSARSVIDQNFDSPHWDRVAARCLNCANCTSSCPTCFCINTEDRSDLSLHTAERVRVWDSCFTQSFSYIHGGSVRFSPKARYRQWLSHKLARWQDQFGTPGCTGCGRCIVWCPAGIDITQEYAAVQSGSRGDNSNGNLH